MIDLTKNQSNFIKLVAILLMIVDHIGAVFFPQLFFLRIIGRGAMFLFAYQIALSYDKTHDRPAFLLRLLIFAAISQLPYYLLFPGLNIFFTLAVGVIAIYLSKKFGWWTIIPILVLAQIAKLDYGFVGVTAIVLSYYFRRDLKLLFLFNILLYVVSFPILSWVGWLNKMWLVGPVGLLSYLFVWKPINLPWHINKWLFYGFYPVHLLIIFLIKFIWFR